MPEKKVTYYLKEVEAHLGALDPVQRAKEVTTLNDFINKEITGHANLSIDDVLKSQGDPLARAKIILSPYHLKPRSIASKRMSPLKFILGLFGLFFIFLVTVVIFIFMKFTPLINIDEKEQKVSLLGGSIQLGADSNFQNSSIVSINKGSSIFSGSLSLSGVKKLNLDFVNASFNFEENQGQELSYQCEKDPRSNSFTSSSKEDQLFLDFRSVVNLECDIQVPKEIALKIRGNNARIGLRRLMNPLDIDIRNGSIEVEENSVGKFNYDVRLMNGNMDQFSPSTDPKAIKVKIKLGNGTINLLN